MHLKLLSLAMGIALMSSLAVPAFAAYMGGYSRLKPTQLIVDPLPECTNAFQCNATFLAGDTITFTGLLANSTGRFIPGATINIYSITATDTKLLTTAITDRDGTFKTTWKAQFIDQRSAGETFKQQLSEVFTIFAKFEGDTTYAASQSGKIIITVQIKDVITLANTDRRLYKAGETAVIFVNFIEAENEGREIKYGNFVDPYTIKVTYDNEPIALSKKKVGSYTFTTPPLTVGHHQLVINPMKEGYNNRGGFITVQVSGFFGK